MKVKEYRIIGGYTQREMADKLGISQPSYSQKENGDRGFTIEEIKKLKKILKVSYEQLFDEKTD